jgi:CheY-like chemotaxis protein
MSSKQRILIAGTGDAVDMARSILGQALDCTCATTLSEALKLVDSRLSAVVCNVSFSDSMMFDFVRAVRANQEFASIPIICFRMPDRKLSDTAHHGLEEALATFDKTTFIDLYALARAGDKVGAGANLLKVVLSQITA